MKYCHIKTIKFFNLINCTKSIFATHLINKFRLFSNSSVELYEGHSTGRFFAFSWTIPNELVIRSYKAVHNNFAEQVLAKLERNMAINRLDFNYSFSFESSGSSNEIFFSRLFLKPGKNEVRFLALIDFKATKNITKGFKNNFSLALDGFIILPEVREVEAFKSFLNLLMQQKYEISKYFRANYYWPKEIALAMPCKQRFVTSFWENFSFSHLGNSAVKLQYFLLCFDNLPGYVSQETLDIFFTKYFSKEKYPNVYKYALGFTKEGKLCIAFHLLKEACLLDFARKIVTDYVDCMNSFELLELCKSTPPTFAPIHGANQFLVTIIYLATLRGFKASEDRVQVSRVAKEILGE